MFENYLIFVTIKLYILLRIYGYGIWNFYPNLLFYRLVGTVAGHEFDVGVHINIIHVLQYLMALQIHTYMFDIKVSIYKCFQPGFKQIAPIFRI